MAAPHGGRAQAPAQLKTRTPEFGAPSQEELQAAQYGIIPARIFRRDVEVPTNVASKILDERGEPIAPDRLFPFVGRPSNTLPDFYFTAQRLASLRNYEQEAKDGSALMLVHDIRDLPIGKSYGAWIETDQANTPEERQAAIERRGGARLALPLSDDDPLAWLFIQYYMVRGLALGKKPNDEVILGIMSGTLDQMSITFYASMIRCNLCGLDIWDWDCPHIPGVEYDMGDAGKVLCLGLVEDGHLVETSLVYKGATPGAMVVETKARMLASAQRLTSSEARQLSAIEARLGHRLIDPAYMSRALGAALIVPRSLNTVNTTKEKGMTKRLTNGRRDVTDPATTDGTDTTTADDLQQVVADQATSDAAALADQIQAKNDQIAALESANEGLQTQITAAQGAVDDQGNPVDNTELIAGLQTQIDANNDQIAGLEAEIEGLQAELDGVNATADATGGTTTDAPATTDTTATTVSNLLARRARAALTSMRGMIANHIAPLRPHARALAKGPKAQVASEARALADSLNSLLSDMGEEPSRSAADRVLFGVLRRATGIASPGIVQVRQLVQEAEAGREYLKDLQDECVRQRVRAAGADKVSVEQYRKMLRSLNVEDLKQERDTQSATARAVFTPGRRVVPVQGSGTVDVPDLPVDEGATETSPTLSFGKEA